MRVWTGFIWLWIRVSELNFGFYGTSGMLDKLINY
jgi:hypothetical protein